MRPKSIARTYAKEVSNMVVTDPASLQKVKSALGAAGYTRDNVRRALQTDASLPAMPGEVVVYERRVAGHTPVETLIRLFLIGSTVSAPDLDAALPRLGSARLESLRLVEPVDGGLRSTVRIVPHGDILLACDRSYYGDPDRHVADVVTGVTSPAILLADLTVRRRVAGALDLGTGGGIQALLLANHCDRVVGVDVNPRAIEFAQLNCGLNGISNVELRQGSWFEPAEGDRFDIVTANPPYVMSPDSTFLYRDSGMRADSLCRELVQAMPDHLEEGGFGHILVSWALRDSQEWSEPLRAWVERAPCDVWLLHYLTEDPLSQSAKWNQPLIADGLEAYDAALKRWTDYYRQEGIDQIAFGAVILRKRSGANWVRADSFRAGHGSSAGLVQRVFDAEDFLRGLRDDEALMRERFALVPEHRLEQRMRSIDGQWQLDEATLTLTQGIAFRGSLDISSAQLLQHLDGRHTLSQAVAKARRDLGLPASDLAPLTETAVAMTRRLYQLGFLARTP
jgi:methylase of polypeptide subunit release factors